MLILTVLQGPDKGRRFELPDHEPQLIGRSTEALPLTDQTISRRHAELTPDEGRWYINDLRSSNGTFVNGQRVTSRRMLHAGDQIRTGNTLFLFGQEARVKKDHGVRVAKRGEIDSHVEKSINASEDSMVMAVPDPGEAAAFNLNVIYRLLTLIGTVADRRELLERVMDLIFECFQADRGFVLLQEHAEDKPEPVVVRHRVKPRQQEDAQITVSRTIVQYVMRKGKGVLTSNAMADQRFSTGDSVLRYGIRSALCVPIKFKERIFGVIHLDSKVANYTYTEDQLVLLTAIGVQTGLALSNLLLYEERVQKERLAAVGETVASLSHSIKNIIQGLRGGAEVVDLGLRKDNMNVVRNGWDIVTRNLERISGLTMNMLAFSKQRTPEMELININPLMKEVVALVQRQFDDKKVALLTELDDSMPPVPVDTAGLHQAVLNLLNNALEAVEPQSGAVSLTTEYDERRQEVRIKVGDNGHGIDATNLKQLFQPFHSTKGLRGTGLGLVVTKKIVEEHGGRIEVETSPEQGTIFLVRLPTAAQAGRKLVDTMGPVADGDPASTGSTHDEPSPAI